jgi:hypothetical protein
MVRVISLFLLISMVAPAEAAPRPSGARSAVHRTAERYQGDPAPACRRLRIKPAGGPEVAVLGCAVAAPGMAPALATPAGWVAVGILVTGIAAYQLFAPASSKADLQALPRAALAALLSRSWDDWEPVPGPGTGPGAGGVAVPAGSAAGAVGPVAEAVLSGEAFQEMIDEIAVPFVRNGCVDPPGDAQADLRAGRFPPIRRYFVAFLDVAISRMQDRMIGLNENFRYGIYPREYRRGLSIQLRRELGKRGVDGSCWDDIWPDGPLRTAP